MAVKDPTKIQVAVPENRMDQIVDIVTGSFVAAPATGSGFAGTYASTNTSDQKPAIAKDYFYTRGIWSIDGGATWQEIGAEIYVGDDSVVGRLFISVGVNSSGANDSAPGIIAVNANNEGFSSQTVLYKVLVMARFDQTIPVPPKQLSQVLRYATKNSYMKIALENKVTLPTAGTTTIPHNLGYVPNFMAWNLFDDTAFGGTDSFMGQSGRSVSADSTNIYCTGHSHAGVQNNILYYRVYLNA